MKASIALALLLTILGSQQFPDTTSVLGLRTSYDKFTDTTTVSVTESILPLRPGFVLLSVLGSVPGRDLRTNNVEVSILIDSRSDQWVYEGPQPLRFLLNGTDRVSPGIMRRIEAQITRDGVHEAMSINVPITLIEKVVSAKTVEVQVGPHEFEIKPEQLSNLKTWLGHFPRRAPQKPARKT